MIKGELIGGKELVKHMGEREGKLRTTLTDAIGKLVLILTREAKLKLSGPVLNVRTGRLRRSVNPRVEGANTTEVAGYVGTNVVYARPHEFGGAVSVKGHLRTIKQAWGKQLKEPVVVEVKPHVVNFPTRSFLRSSLTELQPEIKRTIKGAVTEALK